MNIVNCNEALSLIEKYKSDDSKYAIKIKGHHCEFGEWLLLAEFGSCYHLYKDEESSDVFIQNIGGIKSIAPKWAEVYKELYKLKRAYSSRTLCEMESLLKSTHSKVIKARIKELMSMNFYMYI